MCMDILLLLTYFSRYTLILISCGHIALKRIIEPPEKNYLLPSEMLNIMTFSPFVMQHQMVYLHPQKICIEVVRQKEKQRRRSLEPGITTETVVRNVERTELFPLILN